MLLVLHHKNNEYLFVQKILYRVGEKQKLILSHLAKFNNL
jgi:hypothetical protein